MKCGHMTTNEYLRMKYFPSSLTKNAFTWFTTLPLYLIFYWTQLERMFHEQFFKGEIKVSLINLMNVKRCNVESIDDYLNGFRQLC